MKHISCDEECSPREYIAELMLIREYQKKQIRLPSKFWNLPEYKHKFANQIRMASKLINAYGAEAVLATLEKEKWCFSLYAKKMPHLIELELAAINQKKNSTVQNQTTENKSTGNKFRRKEKSSFKDG